MRRRNSWDSSSGCSSSSESVQLRPPTSPAIVVARRPGPATHKPPRKERPGSDVKGGDSGVSSLWVRRVSPLPRLAGLVRPGCLSWDTIPRGGRSDGGVCRGNEWHFKSGRKKGKREIHGADHDWSRLHVTCRGRGRRDSRSASRERGGEGR